MLKVDDLHFGYGSQSVLTGLSFELHPGQIVGFVGNNGSGKTTTLSIISGLLHPQQGTVEWNGTSIWSEDSTYRSEFGYVPDVPPLFKNATVRENLTYTAKLRRISESLVTTVLDELHLRHIEDQPISCLSTGWRQWVGIAQGWMHRPKLLILDEPTSGLDPSSRQRFEQWTQQIKQDGHTLFFSSHIIREVEAISDRIIRLTDGRVTGSHKDSWTIQCMVMTPDSQMVQRLEQLEGVEHIDIVNNHIRLHCSMDCRSSIAQILVDFGLIEMRRL